MLKYILLFGLITLGIIVSSAMEYPYCFSFFWMGPYPKNHTIANGTCKEITNDNKIPCRTPILASPKPPSVEDLWSSYRDNPNAISCSMVPGQMCVKYTYLHYKAVQNITYMCAKVNTSTGCYRQKFLSGSVIEVCICDSQYGAFPCNAINRAEYELSLLSIALIALTLFRKLCSNTTTLLINL